MSYMTEMGNRSMVSHYLSALKAERHMTYQQIADLSGVGLSTVERILSGKAKDSSFKVLRDITLALQGNLDDLSAAIDSTPGIHPETWGAGPVLPKSPEAKREVASSADLNRMMDMFSDMLREKDDNYERHMDVLNKRHADEIDRLRNDYEADIEQLRADHEREIAVKNRWITWLFVICMLLVLSVLFAVAYDMMHPGMGWVLEYK